MRAIVALLFRFSKRYAFPYWPWYLGGVFFLALTNWLSVRIPVEMARGIDALREGAPEQVAGVVKTIAWMGIAVIVVRTLSRVAFFTPGRLLEYRIKNDLFERLTDLQADFYSTHDAGDLISRSTSDMTFVRAMVGFGGLQICNIALALAFTGREMVGLSPILTLWVLSPVVLGLLILQVGIFRMHSLTRRAQVELGDLSANILSTLQGVRTVQGFNAEPAFTERFQQRNQRYLDTNLTLITIRSLIMPLLGLAGAASIYLLIAVGGPMAIEGEVTVGELVAFVAFVAYLLWPLMSLGWLLSVFQRGVTSMERIDAVLYAEPTRPEGDSGVELPAGAPDLRIRGLDFSWPGDGEPALSQVDLDIPAGSVVGIYGRTGSGKSTLLDLLTRAWNPPPGTIFAGGVDLCALDLDAWRRKLAVVRQVPFLFSDSIATNVAMGEPDPERLALAIERAALSGDLDALPNGLDTVVGERGIMLSGGQRQRTALARALYRDFDVLVLDDVLSAVDQKTERQLIDTLESVAGGDRALRGRPTTIIVSHRMSVLSRTDFVAVLEEGRLVDVGPHRELIAKDGPYRAAWQHQQDAEASP